MAGIGGRVEVWQEQDGLWRWRYSNDDGVDLLSNESHPTVDRAIHAASVAYPKVPIDVRSASRPGGPKRRGLAPTAGRLMSLLFSVVMAIPIAIGALARRLARLVRR